MAANNSRQDEGNQDAHIPVSLRDPVLEMSAQVAYTGDLLTVFIGIVNNVYTEQMWSSHAQSLAALFGIAQPFIIEIKVRAKKGEMMVDDVQLGVDVTAAIEAINSTQVDKIRIVGMGISSAPAMNMALESLVRGWKIPWDQKKVQFVALGESAERSYLHFCKMLCLKKLCVGIQFYMTMDYNLFGFLDVDCTIFAQMSRDKLAKPLPGWNKEDQ